MTTSFTEFYNNTTSTDEGLFELKGNIPHIETLPVRKFISVIENLHNYRITEKLDGSNLIVGYTNQGEFYTSREAKGKSRYFSIHNYANCPANNAFKNAHSVLEHHPALKQCIGNGNQVECEILYGRQPNAIVYGENHIVFLRGLPGDAKRMPSPKIMESLTSRVCNTTMNSNYGTAITSTDGTNLIETHVNPKWVFSTTTLVDPKAFDEDVIASRLTELKDKLHEQLEGRTIEEWSNVKLTTIPKSDRDRVKSIRERAELMIQLKKDAVKSALVKTLNSYSPALRTVPIVEEEDYGIEGVVLLDEKSLDQVKVVETAIFTEVNKFNFAVRNQIKATSHVGRSTIKVLDTEHKDVYGNLLETIAGIHGCEELGDYLKITKFIKANKGNTVVDTINNIVDILPNKQWNYTDSLIESLNNLHNLRTKYINEWGNIKHTLPNGKVVKYNDSIHERNLMFFAEVNAELVDTLQMLDQMKSQSVHEAIGILYSKQLQSVHQLP